MRVIIAGSRDYNDYEFLKQYCDKVLSNLSQVEIVCGECSGADKLGERYAKERGFNIKYFPANWNKYGKSAGYRRNEEMAQYGQALIAFWIGTWNGSEYIYSKGTGHMVDLAEEYGLKIRVKKFLYPF